MKYLMPALLALTFAAPAFAQVPSVTSPPNGSSSAAQRARIEDGTTQDKAHVPRARPANGPDRNPPPPPPHGGGNGNPPPPPPGGQGGPNGNPPPPPPGGGQGGPGNPPPPPVSGAKI